MDQARWDNYGKERIAKIRDNPTRYIIKDCPVLHIPGSAVEQALGDIRGKRVLDLGCGYGAMSIWLAKQGAQVTGVDLGASLLEAAKVQAELNGVSCEFRQANIVSLPLDAKQFDAVTGMAILHHLSEEDVRTALLECLRVLKPSGQAHFHEPIENSKVFDFLQNCFPAGGGATRPSILNRSKWKAYLKTVDDRAMTERELKRAGEGFSAVHFRHFGLTVRLTRLIGEHYRQRLVRLDNWLFTQFPWIKRYAQCVLVTYTK